MCINSCEGFVITSYSYDEDLRNVLDLFDAYRDYKKLIKFPAGITGE